MKLSQKNKWSYLLMLYALVVPFGSALPNILSGVIAATTLYDLLFGNLKISKEEWKIFFICNAFYFFFLASVLWSTSFSAGLEKISLLSLIPLMFLGIMAGRKYLNVAILIKIIQLFTLSTITLFIVSIILAILKNGFTFDAVSAQNLSTAFVDLHYLSFSLYCAIALVLFLFVFLKFRNLLWPINSKIAPVIILVLWAAILLSTSRTSIFFTGIIIVYMIFFVKNNLSLKRRTLVLFVFVSANIIVIGSSDVMREKLKEAINYNDDYDVKKTWGGRGFRELIWNCSIHLFNENPLIGVGFGDQQKELDLCYRKYRYNMLLIKGNVFNAHNIFLQVLIGTGIIGLLFFLLSLTYPIYIIGKSPPFYTYFILIVMLLGFTESYFNRNAFISLFAFFSPLILFSIYNREIPKSS